MIVMSKVLKAETISLGVIRTSNFVMVLWSAGKKMACTIVGKGTTKAWPALKKGNNICVTASSFVVFPFMCT